MPFLIGESTSTTRDFGNAKCGQCGLFKTCKSPKMPPTGEGKKGIFIIAEAPGEEEDKQNKQLVGKAGQFARLSLMELGVNLDRDCWKTNALICRPPKNRAPKNDEIDCCRPNMMKAFREYNPTVVLLFGDAAIRSFIGPLWRENTGPMSQWVGWKIPAQKHNVWIVPTYHPSYIKRCEKEDNGPVLKLWFERHLESAVELSKQGRPWESVPDYANEVQVVLNPNEAAAKIRRMMESKKPISVDYETNRLKPDNDDAEIICCSICFGGKETIGYPWVGDAIKATGEILKSSIPKIGANNKFEDRWTRKVFGHGVNNWQWDTMLSAHHLDSRSRITSVKFQAFVRLGFSPWDIHIKPFLTDANEKGVNRARSADLEDLIRYCAIDSLVEYKLALIQKKEMLNDAV